MSIISILLTAIGLSMDAFAVSLTIGLNLPESKRKKAAIKAGIYFGLFQALMPFIGWILGVRFTKYIESIDHWIAFILLGIIGAKMIMDSIKDDEDENVDIEDDKRFLFLAIATSIDALAVGVSLAFLNINIFTSVIIIGLTTFIISMIGVFIGKVFGSLLKNKAGIIGGIILILIGTNILLRHLNVF